jgi:GT2 family glycosyltransferase
LQAERPGPDERSGLVTGGSQGFVSLGRAPYNSSLNMGTEGNEGAGPAVSVVIPAYRAEATIGVCLAALERQTLEPGRFEVIVVDDASPDGTAAVAEAHGARVLRQADRGGPARARNAGVRAAQGAVVVFTDADCEPAPDFLERLTAPLDADPAVRGTKGAYWSRQRPLVARFVQLEYEDKYDRMARVARARGGAIDFVDTYAAAFRRADLLEVGGFDESFPDASVEDQELSFRLAARGSRLVFVPEARVYHHGHAASLRAYARKKMRIGYWKVAVLGRHPGKVLKDSHTPETLKAQVALALVVTILLPVAALTAALAGPHGGSAARVLAAGGLALGLLLLSALPFTAKALARGEPAVALAAPFLLVVRAFALGAGLALGLASRPRLAGSEPVAAREVRS